jgi:hypothetical protein
LVENTVEWEAFFEQASGWEEFYAAFPHARGLLWFSLPGYNLPRTAAMVLISGAAGMRDGFHSLYYLEKSSETWSVRWEVVLSKS